MDEPRFTPLEKAVSMMGGQSALAAELGVSRQFLHQWLSGSRPIPILRAIEIERATDGRVRVEALLPDVPWEVIRARPELRRGRKTANGKA